MSLPNWRIIKYFTLKIWSYRLFSWSAAWRALLVIIAVANTFLNVVMSTMIEGIVWMLLIQTSFIYLSQTPRQTKSKWVTFLIIQGWSQRSSTTQASWPPCGRRSKTCLKNLALFKKNLRIAALEEGLVTGLYKRQLLPFRRHLQWRLRFRRRLRLRPSQVSYVMIQPEDRTE